MASSGVASMEMARVLATSLLHIQTSHYMLVSAVAIWAYDTLLTLHDELELLWARGGYFVKMMYILNRYLPLVAISTLLIEVNPQRGPITVYACQVQFIVINVCRFAGIIVATTIFTVRLYTIYHDNNLVRYGLVLLAIGSHISIVVCGTLMTRSVVRTMAYSTRFSVCFGEPTGALGGIYVTPIMLESAIALATLLHAIKYRRHRRDLQHISTMTNVMNALYVDGFAYYLMVLTLRIGTCLVYWTAPRTLLLLLCYFEYIFTSTVTARWFLSFRRVLILSLTPQASSYGTTITHMTGAIIDFAPGGSTGMDDLGKKGKAERSTQSGGQDASYVEIQKTQSVGRSNPPAPVSPTTAEV